MPCGLLPSILLPGGGAAFPYPDGEITTLSLVLQWEGLCLVISVIQSVIVPLITTRVRCRLSEINKQSRDYKRKL